MSRSYQVKFWKIKRNASSKKPSYVVRWTVDGKECSTTLGGSELAENFLSDLRQAARRGEWFDTDTGLPESMLKAKSARTWLEFARAYMNVRWPHQAAKSREGTVETLVAVTLTLTTGRNGRPDPKLLRKALRNYVFLPKDRQAEPDAQADTALRWLEAASLPMTELNETRHARAALEVLAVRLDGQAAALSTFRRKRAVFHHALEYAVELGELDANPLDRIKLKPAKSNNVVDRRVVINPQQARDLLIAVPHIGRTRGRMLAAMFACMYFAGLRPAEAQGLRKKDCILPAKGWGQITPTKTRPQSSTRYTDSGRSFDERGLKQREEDEDRDVPIPPELVTILRAHIETFGTAPDGRLFYTRGGGTFSGTAYTTVWQEARRLALTPEQVASPLAGRPYDLRHAAVSLWLNAGVHAPEVAERAGHSVDVLLKIYAKCIDGQREVANQRIERALES
ncbi:site-specific recombinase XerD [Nonomuraea polychroma]|uniref:Site-specific recombinase XerD n=1 Tax=Nonomuraea polychroma TaxID=46176 RepID=A0A438M0C8_9ACTN|nr:tyrosine-type recombinase/integrase [Nonomuraea polychroma]RVX39111.1 site-specific recombinase XerD [Nonomuraea polychroma]